MRLTLLLSIFGLFLFQNVCAQKFPEHAEQPTDDGINSKSRAFLVHLAYGTHLPGADFAERFGRSNTIGGGIDFLMKNNVFIGVDGHYLFGQKVKEDVLAPITTDSGLIVGNNMTPAQVVLRQRGQYLGGQIGKIFTFGAKQRAGLRVVVGAGVLRHKIRVQDDAGTLTQLTGEYAKGYDRLTGGLALNQFLGYQFLGKTRTINFFAGLEFNQGFTKSLRDWDFAEKKKLEGTRTDLRWGIRVGWTMPIYFKKTAEIYY